MLLHIKRRLQCYLRPVLCPRASSEKQGSSDFNALFEKKYLCETQKQSELTAAAPPGVSGLQLREHTQVQSGGIKMNPAEIMEDALVFRRLTRRLYLIFHQLAPAAAAAASDGWFCFYNANLISLFEKLQRRLFYNELKDLL